MYLYCMDVILLKTILKYLQSTYQLDYESMIRYEVLVKPTNTRQSLRSVYDDIVDVFDLKPLEARMYFNLWVDNESIRLDNKLADDQYTMFEKTGSSVVRDSDQEEIRSVVGSMTNMVKLRTLQEVNPRLDLMGSLELEEDEDE